MSDDSFEEPIRDPSSLPPINQRASLHSFDVPLPNLDPGEELKEDRVPESDRQRPSAPLEERKEDHAGSLIALDAPGEVSSSASDRSNHVLDLLLPGTYSREGSRSINAELLQFSSNADEEIQEEIESGGSSPHGEIAFSGISKSTLHASSIRDDRWICPICLELFCDPVETPCISYLGCHNLFCEQCVGPLSRCPLCQRLLDRCIPNIPIRRLMEELSVQCKHKLCSAVIKRQDLRKHESECEMALVRCVHSDECGEIIKRDYEKHINELCMFRPVSCPLECGAILPVSTVEEHVEHRCSNANVECPLDCGSVLRRGDLEGHKKEECPNAVVKCANLNGSGGQCQTSCLRKELAEHQLVCNYRKVICANAGCHERIVYIYLEDHEKVCKHKVIPCANSCGATMKRGLVEKHLLESCLKQAVSCPFHHCGCGECVIRQDLNSHLQTEALKHSLLAAEKIETMSREMTKLKNDLELLRSNHRDDIRNIFNEIRKMKGSAAPLIGFERRMRDVRPMSEEEVALLPQESNNAFDEFLRGLDPLDAEDR